MHKSFSVLVCMTVSLSVFTYAYSGGDGTSGNPFQISNPAGWQTLMATPADWDNYFVLTADISLQGVTITPAGNSTTSFTGVFNGSGHTISNAVIHQSGNNYMGLFGYVGTGGQIKNLGLINADIQGRYYVGGLAGWNSGTISLCYVTGVVSGTYCVGVLAGANGGTISSCYATGTVSADSSVGGFAGLNSQGKVIRCYSTSRPTGTTDVGGFCGRRVTGGNYEDTGNFWDTQTSWTSVSAMGTGKTTAQMKTLSTFQSAAWDFTTIWFMPYDGYPYLRWELDGRYSGGLGRADRPYEISNAAGWITLMTTIADWTGKYFVLTQNISLSGVTVTPVGTLINNFTGVFEGGGHTISNAVIHQSGNDYIGLFGYIGSGGQIKNLGLINADIQGRYYVGGLAGWNYGVISFCRVTGTVNGTNDTGGLVGYNMNGAIQSCYATAAVSGPEDIGGLVGYNDGWIHFCYAAGMVSGAPSHCGGLVGDSNGYEIKSSFWDVEASGQTDSCLGKGLTTQQMKTMSICQNAGWAGKGWVINDGIDYPRLSWEATSGVDIPAAVIPLSGAGTAIDPYLVTNEQEFALLSWYYDILDKQIRLDADLNLAGIAVYPIGDLGIFNGFFDGNGHTISNVAIDLGNSDYVGLFGYIGSGGQVQHLDIVNADIRGRSFVGGLAGYNYDDYIDDCSVAGTVIAASHVGGFIGYNQEGALFRCSAAAAVSGTTYVGGLIGHNDGGSVSVCDASGSVMGNGGSCSYAGGLVGYNYSGTINSSHATGSVSGTDYIGGLTGFNYQNSVISFSHAAGSVSGTGNFVGGAVGYNISSSINSCYAIGAVSGTGQVGGLAGYNAGGTSSVSNCYSTGQVSGFSSFGGLVGGNIGSVSSSFWDTQTSGITTSAGGTGKPTAEMKTLSTYTAAGWDLTNTWFLPYDGYLRLRWEKYTDGTGTASDPFQIASIEDLYMMMGLPEDWDQQFVLTADLDLAGILFNRALIAPDTDAVANSFQGTVFNGVFDGVGHVIRNMTISGAGKDYVGLFGSIFGGVVRNLGIENANIEGRNYAGGLAGFNYNSTIDSCYATGEVMGAGSASSCIGGLTGSNTMGTIRCCYMNGAVSGNSVVGGLTGQTIQGKVIHCYSTGLLTGTSNVGGLCGLAITGGNYEDTANFWDTQTSGTSVSAMGTGKTTAEMKTLSTYTAAGWDFTDMWFMPYNSYPHHQWNRYAGGLGTEAQPYLIGSVEDLYDMMGLSEEWDASFVLTADLDLSGVTFTRTLIAPDTSLLIGFQGTVFSGVFDGGGHVIKNLHISGGTVTGYRGLFGFVGDTSFHGKAGVIRNLGVMNANVQGGTYTGAIVGKLHHGTVSNCFSTGAVGSTGSYAGGLVGYLGPDASEFWTCSANDSYSKCTVTGNTTVGGLIGINYQGQVTHCYSTGQPAGISNVGGFCGAVTTGGSYADTGNFWDTATSQTTISAMGLGKATRTMKVLTIYSDAGWDFSATWTLCERSNYPRFQWQVPAADWICPDGVSVEDLRYFVARWLMENCAASDHCQGADLNISDKVDLADFSIFAALWLEGI